MGSSSRLFAVFLVYYEGYYEHALKVLRRILARVDADFSIVVVSNNQAMIGDGFLVGDNRNWEFTGWDVGLGHFAGIGDDDCVVLCNDTFCFHREFGYIDELRYSSAIKRLMGLGGKGICGEVGSLSCEYEILGYKSDRWISTHFFAVSGYYIKLLSNRISLDERVLDQMVNNVSDAGVVWGEGVSDDLQKFIEEWIFNDTGGWYKARSADCITKLRKIKTILNEFYLSAYCIQNGAMLVDAMPGRTLSMFRRIKNRL